MMQIIASAIIVGSVLGMLIDWAVVPPCKEGYVRITMLTAPSVCVTGYYRTMEVK